MHVAVARLVGKKCTKNGKRLSDGVASIALWGTGAQVSIASVT